MTFEFKVRANFVFWAPPGAVAKTKTNKITTVTLEDLAALRRGESLTKEVIVDRFPFSSDISNVGLSSGLPHVSVVPEEKDLGVNPVDDSKIGKVQRTLSISSECARRKTEGETDDSVVSIAKEAAVNLSKKWQQWVLSPSPHSYSVSEQPNRLKTFADANGIKFVQAVVVPTRPRGLVQSADNNCRKKVPVHFVIGLDAAAADHLSSRAAVPSPGSRQVQKPAKKVYAFFRQALVNLINQSLDAPSLNLVIRRADKGTTRSQITLFSPIERQLNKRHFRPDQQTLDRLREWATLLEKDRGSLARLTYELLMTNDEQAFVKCRVAELAAVKTALCNPDPSAVPASQQSQLNSSGNFILDPDRLYRFACSVLPGIEVPEAGGHIMEWVRKWSIVMVLMGGVEQYEGRDGKNLNLSDVAASSHPQPSNAVFPPPPPSTSSRAPDPAAPTAAAPRGPFHTAMAVAGGGAAPSSAGGHAHTQQGVGSQTDSRAVESGGVVVTVARDRELPDSPPESPAAAAAAAARPSLGAMGEMPMQSRVLGKRGGAAEGQDDDIVWRGGGLFSGGGIGASTSTSINVEEREGGRAEQVDMIDQNDGEHGEEFFEDNWLLVEKDGEEVEEDGERGEVGSREGGGEGTGTGGIKRRRRSTGDLEGGGGAGGEGDQSGGGTGGGGGLSGSGAGSSGGAEGGQGEAGLPRGKTHSLYQQLFPDDSTVATSDPSRSKAGSSGKPKPKQGAHTQRAARTSNQSASSRLPTRQSDRLRERREEEEMCKSAGTAAPAGATGKGGPVTAQREAETE